MQQSAQQMQDALSQDYAQQFLTAIRSLVGVRRNEAAIADEHFPEVDLMLRRGRHIGRDDGTAPR